MSTIALDPAAQDRLADNLFKMVGDQAKTALIMQEVLAHGVDLTARINQLRSGAVGLITNSQPRFIQLDKKAIVRVDDLEAIYFAGGRYVAKLRSSTDAITIGDMTDDEIKAALAVLVAS